MSSKSSVSLLLIIEINLVLVRLDLFSIYTLLVSYYNNKYYSKHVVIKGFSAVEIGRCVESHNSIFSLSNTLIFNNMRAFTWDFFKKFQILMIKLTFLLLTTHF